MSKTTNYNSSATNVKEFPTPGYNYKLKHEKRGLIGIAERAYGDPKRWKEIWAANKDHARWSRPDVFSPKELNSDRGFWVGDIIFIPGDKLVEEIRDDVVEYILGDAKDKFRLIINEESIDEVTSANVVRSIDTAAIGWTAVAPWNPDNAGRKWLYRPFGYPPARAYLGGNLVCRGLMYVSAPKIEPTSRYIELGGWSFVADAIDSTVSAPLEANKITLEKRARQLLEPLGLRVIWDAGEDKPFSRVTAEKTDKIFDHLSKLAKQRDVLIMSTSQGDVKFTKIDTSGPVDLLAEGWPPFTKMEAKFDGRERFSSYTCLSSTPKKNKGATVNDENIPRSRRTIITANEGNEEDVQTTAEAAKRKAIADALTIPFPVNSWYNSAGDLWEPNKTVTVQSPSLFVSDGFDFLIRSVEYMFSVKGSSAILNLVPPQVYTGESIEDIWS